MTKAQDGLTGELPNFRERISYINDFPFNMVQALIRYFETGEDQNVEFNAEGYYYTFKFSSNVTVEGNEVYGSTIDFANDFVNEIEKDLEAWAHFKASRTSDENYKELAYNVAKLRMKLLDKDKLDKWLQIIS